MSLPVTDLLPSDRMARITGGFYLAFILASVLADSVAHIGLGDADQLYRTISTDVDSFRLGLMATP